MSCYLCSKKQDPTRGISLHRFPMKNPEILKEWVYICGLSLDTDDVRNVKLCSSHFRQEDFTEGSVICRRLLKTAIPTKYVCNSPQYCAEGNVSLVNSSIAGTMMQHIKPQNLTNADVNSSVSVDYDRNVAQNLSTFILDAAQDTMISPNYKTKDNEDVCSSPKKRRFNEPRYINEIRIPDFATPGRAKRVIEMVKSVNRKQKHKIHQLQNCVYKLRRKVQLLTEMVAHMKKQNVISYDAVDKMTEMSALSAKDECLPEGDPFALDYIIKEAIKNENLENNSKEVSDEHIPQRDLKIKIKEEVVDDDCIRNNDISVQEEEQPYKETCNDKLQLPVKIEEVIIKKEIDSDKEESNDLEEQLMDVPESYNDIEGDPLELKSDVKTELTEEFDVSVGDRLDEDILEGDVSFKTVVKSCSKEDVIDDENKKKLIDPFVCRFCKQSFSQSSELKEHLHTHSSEKPFSCRFCNKSFSHSLNLTEHLRTHTGRKPFSCRFCSKSFSQSQCLKDHLLIHSDKEPSSCKFCNKTFIYASSLKSHLLAHAGEKPFTCQICNKSFSYSTNLKNHLNIHTGEKPYSCQICKKLFTRSYNLKMHLDTHTGNKQFTCPICNLQYSQSSGLKRHIRTHTGEKPYSCQFCNKSYADSRSLKGHLCTHAIEKPLSS